MKKITYSTPSVEITTWDKADVITTSGVTVNQTAVPVVGDTNYTANISYNDILSN